MSAIQRSPPVRSRAGEGKQRCLLPRGRSTNGVEEGIAFLLRSVPLFRSSATLTRVTLLQQTVRPHQSRFSLAKYIPPLINWRKARGPGERVPREQGRSSGTINFKVKCFGTPRWERAALLITRYCAAPVSFTLLPSNYRQRKLEPDSSKSPPATRARSRNLTRVPGPPRPPGPLCLAP